MRVDLLIIGQGISGTCLSLEAHKAGLTFVVLDDARPDAASRVASGLINPVTGKRVVTTWLAPDLLPFARTAYADILGRSYLRETHMVSFFQGPDARLTFLERVAQDPTYLARPDDEGAWAPLFQYDFGYGVVRSCGLVDLAALLRDVRADLLRRGLLRTETFEVSALEPGAASAPAGGARYHDTEATHVIFCDGAAGAAHDWFGILPFSPSKGEALIVEAPDLPEDVVYKKGLHLVPLGNKRFWAGASYEWNFTDALPTQAFRTRTEQALKAWLRVPFHILDHVAAIRPTTVEQKPFVGLHPVYPSVGIFGGMGTKGCSLAPYFARQLAQHIAHGAPILGAADVRRFSRMLGADPRT